MPKPRLSHVSWALRLVGLLVFPALFILNRNLLSDAIDAVRDAQPGYLVAATALMLVASVVRAARWRILAETVGVRYRRFTDYLSIYYAGLFLGAAVPQIAASFAPVVLMSEDGHSWKRSSASIVFDRLIETAMILAVAAVAAIYLAPEHPRMAAIVLLVSGGGIAAGIALAWLTQRAPRLLARIERGPLTRLRPATDMFVSPEAHAVYRGVRRRVLPIAGLSAAAVLLQVTVVVLLAESLGLEASVVFLAAAAAMVVLVVMLPISIAGLGSREAMLVLLFSAAGEPKEAAVALGVLLFAVGIVARLPGAAGWMRRRMRHNALAPEAIATEPGVAPR